ncbi:MAG: hypothetical protein L3K25_09060 [Gammaproteobacteria bacterium]|nr:hypothetical protein [Gammaproteobacteria bacterium]
MTGSGGVAFADGWDPRFSATNIGSIEQTRHNLTLSYNNSSNAFLMNSFRNNYGETCVYCHTPHGANTQINAPLWNRTINNADNYSIYDTPTTLGLEGRLNLPGPSSLTCLSCHDGTIAIDSVLNMPGSGLAPGSNLRNLEVGSPNEDFLNRWVISNPGMGPTGNHLALGPEPGTGTGGGCSICHNINSDSLPIPFAPDFSAFILGTNLRNDHVVGITYPTTFGPGIDYNEPEVIVPGKWSFFDSNGNRFAEKDEVRLYDSGNGPAVECASCHDPHGIPSNGPGTEFIPSFLRISNSTPNSNGIGGPSGLCLTCHAK